MLCPIWGCRDVWITVERLSSITQPRVLRCDSTHKSSLTLTGAKCSVAEAGALPDPRGVPAVVWEPDSASIPLHGSGCPAKNPLLYKSQHMM